MGLVVYVGCMPLQTPWLSDGGGKESSSDDHEAGQGECEGSAGEFMVLEAYIMLGLHIATPSTFPTMLFAFSSEIRGSRCILQH